jgi:hypothetical protein
VFQSTLKGPPYDIVVVEGDDGAYAVDLEIARNDTRAVVLSCRLAGHLQDGVAVFDFSFLIAVAPLDGCGESFETQDGRITKKYIPSDLRPQIVSLVRDCLRSLIGKVQPEVIYRVLKGRNAPEKCLRKHHLITDTLSDLGYRVHDHGTDAYGRLFFVMRRGDN